MSSSSSVAKNINHYTANPHQNNHSANKYYVDYKSFSIGDLKQSTRSSDHNGWLKCDGRTISRIDYAELYNIIGTSFGVGDGSTTFTLPDARGRVIGTVGAGAGLTARTLGQNVGAETHTLTVNQIPSHSHTITDPGHTHSYANNTNDQGVSDVLANETAADNADLGSTTGSSTTGITVNNTGGGQSFNIMQPTLFAASTFIYAKTVLVE